MKHRDGFSVIEIIAVLVILGILSVYAVPKFLELQNTMRIRVADAAISQIKAVFSLSMEIIV